MAKTPKNAWDRLGNLIDRDALVAECREASKHVMRDDGTVNWRAAFFADPGVTSCPVCKEYLMHEGSILECVCGVIFNTSSKEIVPEPNEDKRNPADHGEGG